MMMGNSKDREDCKGRWGWRGIRYSQSRKFPIVIAYHYLIIFSFKIGTYVMCYLSDAQLSATTTEWHVYTRPKHYDPERIVTVNVNCFSHFDNLVSGSTHLISFASLLAPQLHKAHIIKSCIVHRFYSDILIILKNTKPESLCRAADNSDIHFLISGCLTLSLSVGWKHGERKKNILTEKLVKSYKECVW